MNLPITIPCFIQGGIRRGLGSRWDTRGGYTLLVTGHVWAHLTRRLRGPLVVGHRGLSDQHPENTLAALRGAVQAGAHGVEVDLRASRDGVAMLVHDLDLTRIAGRPEQINELDADELAQIEVTLRPPHSDANPGGAPETILSFDQAYDAIGPSAAWFVEIKTDARCVEQVAARWRRTPPLPGSAVISFDRSLCRLARARLPATVAVGRLHHEGDVGPDCRVPVLEQTLEDQLDILALHRTHWSRRWVRRCRDAGVKTLAWTANHPRSLSQLRAMGVETIISDLPESVSARLYRGRWPLWAGWPGWAGWRREVGLAR